MPGMMSSQTLSLPDPDVVTDLDSTPPLAMSSGNPSRNASFVATAVEPGIYYSTDTLATSNSGKGPLVPEDVDDGKQHFGVDENKDRGNWSGRLDFLLSCLGFAVGLGNVWRFPYLCYRNGGGAFFIPYIIMLVFVGIPLFFLELSLGQFCSSGPLTCWKFAPLFKGIGIAQLIVSGLVAIYYNVIIGWSLFYLFSSLIHAGSGLPWASCENDWNTPECSQLLPPEGACVELTEFPNGTCYNETSLVRVWNYSIYENITGLERKSPSEEYYNHRVMRLSSGIDDMGPVEWDLALSLLGAWVIAFLCMVQGIKSSGKVVYFTALFPYVVLVILLGRGASLPNAIEGIIFYVRPKWERLADAKVWNDAAVQIFFSLSNCWGGLIALSSYNRFHNNCLRDTLIVAIGNCATSVFAGFVIFSFLGYMAGQLNKSVEEVVNSGPGLAFIVYPAAVTQMPLSPLWAVLFFLMLITLGLDSQFAMLETILTSLLDQFQFLRRQKWKVILCMCVVLFLLGLPMCAHGGAYLQQLMDTYCGGWAILIIGLLECIAIAWIYGVPRFYEDIQIMTGNQPALWWRLCWQFLSPLLILFILFFSWIDYSPAHYGDKYYFPSWADGLGWLMSFCSIIWIPIMAAILLYRTQGTLRERFKKLCQPTFDWGPALVKHRKLVDYVPGFLVDPWGTGTKREHQGHQNWAMNQVINGAAHKEKPAYNNQLASAMNAQDRTRSELSISYQETPAYDKQLASATNASFRPRNGTADSMGTLDRTRSELSIAHQEKPAYDKHLASPMNVSFTPRNGKADSMGTMDHTRSELSIGSMGNVSFESAV